MIIGSSRWVIDFFLIQYQAMINLICRGGGFFIIGGPGSSKPKQIPWTGTRGSFKLKIRLEPMLGEYHSFKYLSISVF
jgi:hypothetical protein